MKGFGEIPLNWLILQYRRKKCLSLSHSCPCCPILPLSLITALSLSLFYPYSWSIRPSSIPNPAIDLPPFPYPGPFQPSPKIKHNANHNVFLASVVKKNAAWKHRIVNFTNLRKKKKKKEHKVYIMYIKNETTAIRGFRFSSVNELREQRVLKEGEVLGL